MVTSRSPRLSSFVVLTILLASVAAAQAPPASLLVPTTRRAPEEFGTQDYTVTVIDATAFTADGPFSTDNGSMSRTFNFFGGHYFAGVNIPTGAVIDFIGLESYSNADIPLVATLFYLSRYSGTTYGIVSVTSTAHTFDTDYNPTALGLLLGQNAHNALVLDVYQRPGFGNSPAFGWVEIWWKRVVSPAPATASFNDVPTSHPFFQFIEALKASGITGGCGGGNYCPDNPLTRGQMAVFLSKALGLHWPY